MSVFDVLASVRGELPGFISSSVVASDDGLQLASVSAVDPDDAAAADAFHSDIYRAAARALTEIGTATRAAEGIVVIGDEHVFLSLPLDDTFFWHVVTRNETTLGFTQAVMRKHRDSMRTAVSNLFAR